MLLERARIWDAVIRAGAVRWSSTSVYSEVVPAYLVTDTGRSKVVEGVTFPSSRAAVIVTILKVDPGSKVSVTGRLRSRSGLIWWRWLGLNRGTVAIARMAPSVGRITMAIALRAPNLARVAASVRSTSFWIAGVDRQAHVLAGHRLAVAQHLDRAAEEVAHLDPPARRPPSAPGRAASPSPRGPRACRRSARAPGPPGARPEGSAGRCPRSRCPGMPSSRARSAAAGGTLRASTA